ncbi:MULTISPECIES: protein phosphatase 2C domain-containing protein [Actinomycetes]|uniref:protein phosphatase 2C domain-containing protein n=1 Tax=Actinomycetes TaxID=1760 RepID=UPI0027BA27BA|nr:protein phosphatase 2C domain-containing protein [Actinospica acidiphila]
MSQMPQQAALSKCPSCEEPLESGDRFCGACGYDLSAVPARPSDDPTIALNGAVPPQSPWPAPTPGEIPPRPATPPGAHVPAAGGPAADAPPHAASAHPASPVQGIAATNARADAAGDAVSADAHRHPTPAAPAAPSPGAPAQPGASPAGPVPHAGTPRASASGAPAPASSAHQAAPGRNPAGADPQAAVPSSYGTGVPAAPGPHPAAPAAQPASASDTAPNGAPAAPVQGRPPASGTGVRLDRRASDEGVAGGDDYTLQAPDPRVAPEPHAAVCVACRAGRVDDDGYCENCGHAQPRERDHMEQECGPVAAVSDRGLRHHRNEDAFAVGTTTLPDGAPVSVAVVCDGVSSATRPDEASLAASRAANASLLDALPRGTHPQQAMHEAILAASEAVDALAGEQLSEAREHAPQQNAPACTIVGAVVTAGLLVVGWVGDSRVYWIPVDRSAPAARLTEDDSWAAQMVAAGLMGEAEAYADHRAHAITGWLGADAYELEPHTAAFKPDRPGVVVVCTDGLWNYAESADDMAEAVPADAAARPLHAARVLVGHALDGGGHDNVTVALVPFPAVPQGAGSA